MGTYFTNGATRQQVIDDRLKSWVSENVSCVTLKHRIVNNVLWTIRETKDHTTGIADKWIGCDLLVAHHSGWGYKPMEESMGPCYYTCPIAWFAEVPCPEVGYAKEWREKVRREQQRPYLNPDCRSAQA